MVFSISEKDYIKIYLEDQYLVKNDKPMKEKFQNLKNFSWVCLQWIV